jgi:hypothetical protein
MQHDIYSLGVCLLEIGLWQSFVWYPYRLDGTDSRGEPSPVPGPALKLRNSLTDKDFQRAHLGNRTGWVKEDLVVMARELLPGRMGDIYAGIVVGLSDLLG